MYFFNCLPAETEEEVEDGGGQGDAELAPSREKTEHTRILTPITPERGLRAQ